MKLLVDCHNTIIYGRDNNNEKRRWEQVYHSVILKKNVEREYGINYIRTYIIKDSRGLHHIIVSGKEREYHIPLPIWI